MSIGSADQEFFGPVARIRGMDKAVCGAGFLIGERHVTSCAHVLDEAAGRARGGSDPPEEPVILDLPFLKQHGLRASVVAWHPWRPLRAFEQHPVSDIAVLELEEPVAGGIGSDSAKLSSVAAGTLFVTYGFPRGMDNGTDAGGELRFSDASGLRQVRGTQKLGRFIEPGFSGAPILGEVDGKLLGMAVLADKDAETRLACVIPTPTLCRAWPPLAEPYKGLEAFGEADEELFFGRAPFVEELYVKIQDHRYLTVIGPSGAGKSSVVMAGLVPRLGRDWVVVRCRPGSRPLYRLAYALESVTAKDLEDIEGRARELEKALRADPRRVTEHVGTLLERMPKAERLLLVIDQFEELFTLDDRQPPDGAGSSKEGESGSEDQEADGGAKAGSARQHEFIAVLDAIGRQGRGAPLQAIATLRADFLGRALQTRTLSDLMRDADVKLGPMSPAELAEAIERPAARFDVGFEPGLVAQIVATMDGADGAGNLPLVQFALERLWRKNTDRQITQSRYWEIGGVEGALAECAEDAHDKLGIDHGPEAQQAARRVLTRLVRLAAPGTQAEDTRAIATREEIGEADWPTVETLAEGRLVTLSRDPASGAQTAEVAHEVLIRAWPRLARWLNEDREFGLWHQRLGDNARQWDGTNPDALLRGTILDEAKAKLRTHKSSLSNNERRSIIVS
ncbi:MAG: serine protease [Pseudomonadota bacterium]